MLTLKNGHTIDFACAAGALAFNGDGWWWEQPTRLSGILDPSQLTIITKTLTFQPLVGNLRWWCPWRCVRLLPGGGAVNAVGLTNPGFTWWLQHCLHHIRQRGYKTIVSLTANNEQEAALMALRLNKCTAIHPRTKGGIYGIQFNQCPNADYKLDYKIIQAVLDNTDLPVSLKLSYTDSSYFDTCCALDDKGLAFYELINSVPWCAVFPGQTSPLARYGYNGSVSGLPIIQFARKALARVVNFKLKTPIVSGGGIGSIEEVYVRRVMGARACTLGLPFLTNVGNPNKIIAACRKEFSLCRRH